MRDLFGDIAIYLVGRALPAVIGLATVWVFVRMLDEDGYGVYAIAYSGANLVSVLLVGWLSQALLRFQGTSRREAPVGAAVGRGIVLISIAAVPAVALLGFGNGLDQSLLTTAVTWLLVIGLSVHAVYAASLQAALRARSVALLEGARAIVALPFSLLGIAVIRPPFVGALLGLACSYALSSIWSARLSWNLLAGHGSRSEARGLLRQFFVFGWPISVWLVVSLLFPFAERLLIGRTIGPAATGQYAATYDVVYRSCGFVLLPIVLAIHPRLMRCDVDRSKLEIKRLWYVGIGLQVAIGAVLTIALSIFAPWVVRATGLDPSIQTVSLVLPLAAAGSMWQVGLMAQKLLELLNRTRSMLVLLHVSLVIDVVLNLALLPKFGPVAAAYSLLAAGMIYTIFVAAIGLRRFERRG